MLSATLSPSLPRISDHIAQLLFDVSSQLMMKVVPHSVSNFIFTPSGLSLSVSISGLHVEESASHRSELCLALCILLTLCSSSLSMVFYPIPVSIPFSSASFALAKNVVDLLSFLPYHCCCVYLSQSTLGIISVFNDIRMIGRRRSFL